MSITTTPQKLRKSQATKSQRHNVFDSALDNTATDVEEGSLRWKFKGPWIAGMTQGAFDEYMEKQLKGRRADFNSFLRAHARTAVETNARARRRHEGYAASVPQGEEAVSREVAAAPSAPEVTEDDIDRHIQTMRRNFSLGSELAVVIQRFLDLPAVSGSALEQYMANFYEQGPPKTHPSAGLSYLRSDGFLDNHPLFGPQKSRTPIEARLLNSSFNQSGESKGGKIGVAGVVTNDPTGPRTKIRSIPNAPNNDDPLEVEDRKSHSIGLGTPGGNRIWVQATALGLDARGRIKLQAGTPDPSSVGVYTGQLAAPDMAEAPKRAPVATQLSGYPSMPRVDTLARGRGAVRPGRPTPHGSSAYGINDRGDVQRQKPKDTDTLMSYLQKDLSKQRSSRYGPPKQ